MIQKGDGPSLNLKWRRRSDGTKVAYWVCRKGKINSKFKPRTVRLWSGVDPTDGDLKKIEAACRRMNQELVEFTMNPMRNHRLSRKPGRIYFIQSRNLVKIGFTTGDPAYRLAKLQIGSADSLTLLGTVEGDQVAERQLHWRFKKHHSHGEWFFLEGLFGTYIRKLFSDTPRPEQALNKA